MKQELHLRRSVKLGRVAYLSLLAVPFLVGFAPSTLVGGDNPDEGQPYRGTVTGTLFLKFNDAGQICPDSQAILMQEVSSHLGRGIQVAEDATLTFDNGSLEVVVESVAVAANGDELWIYSKLMAPIFDFDEFAYRGTYSITEGTGRFKGATGSGELIEGMAKVVPTEPGRFALMFSHEFTGTISYDASTRSSGKRKRD